MADDVTEFVISERDSQLKRLEEIRSALAEARQTGNWDKVPEEVYQDYLKKVVLTSAPSLANYRDFKELDFITAECIYQLDLSSPLPDSSSHPAAEIQLEQANQTVLDKIRARALRLNADAVISIDIKHQLLEGEGSKKRFVVIATGTAVRFV